MKLVTTARQLRDATKLLRPIVPRHSTYPILGCVLIDGCFLAATDLDLELRVQVAAEYSDGCAAVDLRRLASLLAFVPGDETVTLTGDEESVRLSFGGARYTLPTISVEAWPHFKFEPGDGVTIGGLKQALGFVRPAVSDEETRYYLNGICFSIDREGRSVIVATDGHRLACHGWTESNSLLRGKIIPRFAVDVLRRLPDPDTLVLDKGGTRLRAPLAGITLTTKLIEGTFPDWLRVTPKPKADASTANVDRASFDSALRRMLALRGKEGSKEASLVVQSDRGAVSWGAITSGYDGCEMVRGVAGKRGYETSFNALYMRSLLAIFAGDEEVTLAQPEQDGAIVMSGRSPTASALLMPMRSSDSIKLARTAVTAQPERAAG